MDKKRTKGKILYFIPPQSPKAKCYPLYDKYGKMRSVIHKEDIVVVEEIK